LADPTFGGEARENPTSKLDPAVIADVQSSNGSKPGKRDPNGSEDGPHVFM